MQDYNTIIGSIQMRLNGCQTRSVMDRYKIGSGTLNLIMSRYHANGISWIWMKKSRNGFANTRMEDSENVPS